jgi:hypothetical protein
VFLVSLVSALAFIVAIRFASAQKLGKHQVNFE